MSWADIDRAKYLDESEAVAALLAAAPTLAERGRARADAESLVRLARKGARREGLADSFLREFGLGTREGMALMCLAEALLRIPDAATRDRLIAEKVGAADWKSHLGRRGDPFVNAATWGLLLTGRLVEADEAAARDPAGFLHRLALRIGEPVVRAALAQAVRIIGEQFVLGRTIEAALTRAGREGLLCSFDMLGEGARTAADAGRYEQAYVCAVEAVGRASAGTGPERGHGISVKLSALSPRFEAVQEARVWRELYPRLRGLAGLAASADIGLTIDAEEADRLTLTLELFDRLAHDPDLGDWRGLGIAVQAYQKRAPEVVERLAALSKASGRRLMVRLVKGAYWDSEIKRAQVAGFADYPVYTTKAATDLSYLVCARRLLASAPQLYPQFATHNAHSLATVQAMATAAGVRAEFQRLQGMGEAVYAAASAHYGDVSVRTYAPVGGHEDLLPYLVRRLLENGANSAFVHQLLDEAVPPEALAADPVEALQGSGDPRHPRIPAPPELYGAERRNSAGLDLSVAAERQRLLDSVHGLAPLEAGPLVAGVQGAEGEAREARAPADRARVVGRVRDASMADVDAAFAAARAAQPDWNAAGGQARAEVLLAMADALEAHREPLIALCAREAGKTLADGIAEVREATDFCRYYAHLARTRFAGAQALPGPVGEANTLQLHGRGVFACISPWNFPLAIFTGQIAAALAAGDAVVAKPAEQTPLIAAEAVRLYHSAGLDPRLLALLPGPGERIGAGLVSHPGCDGVAFTGGVETARSINRALAERAGPIIPFIAETGGLNGMFVDTTALREQVIDDVIVSAFGSAGQRCSALRLLFLPHETADDLIEGIAGAMDALVIGDPADPATDVGPVIDMEARAALEAHMGRLEREARVLHRLPAPGGGTFFGPVLAELETARWLGKEVFGPILHVVRYDPADLEIAAGDLAAAGYGLTLGVHSRLEGFAEAVRRRVPAGNVYVNRSIIGAVVGVQPFGGEGLSGTGPKAGGPNALSRYAVERAVSVNIMAQGGDPTLLDL